MRRFMRRAFAAPIVFLWFAAIVSGGSPPSSLQKLWLDLSSGDEGRVARATLQLATRQDETVSFLKTTLRPVKEEPARVAELIADLSSETFATRDRATAELEYYGKYIQDTLKKALADKPGAEASKRIKTLLAKIPNPDAKPKPRPALPDATKGIRIMTINGKVIINGVPLDQLAAPPPPSGPPAPPSAWIRVVRAVAVLEHIGTPAAIELIERLAQGEPDALPTMEARAALERLREKK